jgi:cytochrome c peroxidase
VALRLVLVFAFVLVLGNVVPARTQALPLDLDTVPSDEPITPVPVPQPANLARTKLGERLFQDPRLSHGNVRSCQTCHDIRLNGASGSEPLTALDGTPLKYQSLTVFNAALSFRLSWEGRYRTLEEQAAASLASPKIMGTTMGEILDKLCKDRVMMSQFEDAFGHGPDAASVLEALATFERSLLTPGSRFDRWLGGDAVALTEQELSGYRLFKSLGCVSCHQGVNVGGNLFERRGIFRPLTADEPAMLRVPSLRNVAVTPPYFHDGSATTLTDAVRRMSRAQLNSTLSDAQVQEIVAFLGTLTGNYRGRPVGENR